jgi:hypothetical protein
MSTRLKIWTAWNVEPREEAPIVIKPPTVQIRVYFELRDRRGMLGVTLIWKMEAPRWDDDAEVRKALLRSTNWERNYHTLGSPDPNNITAIEVDDPTGLLKWLCPGQDLKDVFSTQNHKLLNDKPLRIAGPGATGL